MRTKFLKFLIPALALLFCASCARNSTNTAPPANDSPVAQTSPTPALTGFDADLEYIRKGQYTYVWVFSRKDGKPLNKEDGDFLRANAPQVVDWVTTDDGKKVIAGTNFDLAQGTLGLI